MQATPAKLAPRSWGCVPQLTHRAENRLRPVSRRFRRQSTGRRRKRQIPAAKRNVPYARPCVTAPCRAPSVSRRAHSESPTPGHKLQTPTVFLQYRGSSILSNGNSETIRFFSGPDHQKCLDNREAVTFANDFEQSCKGFKNTADLSPPPQMRARTFQKDGIHPAPSPKGKSNRLLPKPTISIQVFET